MAREPTSVQQLEFERLRGFVKVVFESWLAGERMPEELYPARLADNVWAQSPAAALRGLREAVNDAVEMTRDIKPAPLADLEARLAEAGAPSLAHMRDRRRRTVFKILQHQGIRNDDEWRLVDSIVADTADTLLTPSSREAASALLGDYERARRDKAP